MNKNLMHRVRKMAFDAANATKETPTVGLTPEEYQLTDIKLTAGGILSEWVKTDDLDDDETLAQRLTSMIYGVADEFGDNDGELDDEEMVLVDATANAVFDLMIGLGVSEDDATAILSDEDDEAAQRVIELLSDAMGDSEDFIDEFVFGGGSNDAVFDAIYKKRAIIKNGKKVIVKKRISGFVKRSAKQKSAFKKARLRSNSGAAKAKRMRSMAKGRSLGLHK